MYNPRLQECGACNTPFVDGQLVWPWFEDYICGPCIPLFIVEQRKPIIWRQNPVPLFAWDFSDA